MSPLQEIARKYAGDRVDKMIQRMVWCNDEYPNIERVLKYFGNPAGNLQYDAAMMFARMVAEEAYLIGILDGGRIHQAMMDGKLSK